MTRSLNVTPKTTLRRRQIWSLSSDNKRTRTNYCFVDANYWRIQNIARPLCNSRAICLASDMQHIQRCVDSLSRTWCDAFQPLCYQQRPSTYLARKTVVNMLFMSTSNSASVYKRLLYILFVFCSYCCLLGVLNLMIIGVSMIIRQPMWQDD